MCFRRAGGVLALTSDAKDGDNYVLLRFLKRTECYSTDPQTTAIGEIDRGALELTHLWGKRVGAAVCSVMPLVHIIATSFRDIESFIEGSNWCAIPWSAIVHMVRCPGSFSATEISSNRADLTQEAEHG